MRDNIKNNFKLKRKSATLLCINILYNSLNIFVSCRNVLNYYCTMVMMRFEILIEPGHFLYTEV